MLVQSPMAALSLPTTTPNLNLTSSSAKKTTSEPIFSDHQYTHLLSLLNDRTPVTYLKQIHAQTLRSSTSHDHNHQPHTIFLLSRILYHASSSDFNYASRIFTQLQSPNSFAWNALIRACANSPLRKQDAFPLYHEMITAAEVTPDKHTFPFVLKACAYLSAEKEGKQAHAHLLKLGFGSDVYVNNSLVHFYASCGLLDRARKVFDEIHERTVVSWNAMIDAFVRCGEYESALKLFVSMQVEGMFEPDAYTVQSVVCACAGLGALSLGKWVHAYMLKNCGGSDVTGNVAVNNSVVDMYCKCGELELARQVFDKMPRRDVNSWNTMILGLASHGKGVMALDCFRVMVEEEKISPSSITFVGVLSACNYSGMVKEGQVWFDSMVKDYKIQPRLEHYGCLIDLLARAGFLDEALDVVSEMSMKPDRVIWRSLLDACCRQNGVGLKLSEEIAEKILLEGSRTSGDYVLLSKLYASAARWDEVGSIRKMMVDQGVVKEPGCSSIEVDGVNHEFFAGDTSHPRREEIYQALNVIDERLKLAGYCPDVSEAQMIDDGDYAKQKALRLHSERFAIAFGLMNRKQGDDAPIRVFKNLRVCRDCHEVTKLISRVFEVEIIVRDRARFHHFKDGVCSCADYW